MEYYNLADELADEAHNCMKCGSDKHLTIDHPLVSLGGSL